MEEPPWWSNHLEKPPRRGGVCYDSTKGKIQEIHINLNVKKDIILSTWRNPQETILGVYTNFNIKRDIRQSVWKSFKET